METPNDRSTLIESSPTTRTWLKELGKGLPQLDYRETKHWAIFSSKVTGRKVAELNPRKKAIRLCLRLSVGEDPALEDTPATRNWRKAMPSLFVIGSEQDLIMAKALIERSDTEDRSRR